MQETADEPSAGAERRPAGDADSSRRRIEADHLALRRQLALLERSADPNEILARLQELKPMLEQHFEEEEAAEGLHESIERTAPHLLPQLQPLFDEHRELLRSIEDLSTRVEDLCEGPLAEIRGRIDELTQQLHDHEARETVLFGDALYRDIGGGS